MYSPRPLPAVVPHHGVMTFTARRAAGLTRLPDFVPRAGRAYAAERTLDRGPGDRTNVSALSPWVRHRLVTENDAVEALLERHSLAVATQVANTCYFGQGGWRFAYEIVVKSKLQSLAGAN